MNPEAPADVSEGVRSAARVIVMLALATGWAFALLGHYGPDHRIRMLWIVATAVSALVVSFAAMPLMQAQDPEPPKVIPTIGYLFLFAMIPALLRFGAQWTAPALSGLASIAITLRMQVHQTKRRPLPPAEEKKIVAFCLLWPFGFALMIGVQGFLDTRADHRSEPFLKAAAFEPLPGCPQEVEQGGSFPERCLDERYLIRRTPERFGLPRPPWKGEKWRRIGRNAIVAYCSHRSCAVMRARPAFPAPV